MGNFWEITPPENIGGVISFPIGNNSPAHFLGVISFLRKEITPPRDVGGVNVRWSYFPVELRWWS